MATDFSFDDKGNVKPKAIEAEGPEKSNTPLTMSEVKGQIKPNTLNRMQQTLGNQAVQRFIAQRSAEGAAELDEDTSSAINSERGGGGSLDEGIAAKAGATMGQDFSDVNVHTDSKADNLSRAVNAKAFTVGNDVFFKQGEYNPGSQSGQHLIAHELTHVVQQGASTPSVQGKMTVNDPNDSFEKEADAVADSVMKMDDADVQRQEMPEEELQARLDVQRQEEEEVAMPKLDVQRQEEEEVMPKLDVQRQEQGMEEEEALQAKLDVQRNGEEEEAMTKRDTLQRHQDEAMHG